MAKAPSATHIKHLKRKAKKIARETGVKQHQALHFLANNLGFRAWDRLMLAAGTPSAVPDATVTTCSAGSAATRAAVRAACDDFIRHLDTDGVLGLCRGGSIWIDLEDFICGKVSVRSLRALGSSMNIATRRFGYMEGLRPLVEWDGLAEMFVFPDDEDDEGKPVVPQHGQLLYSTASGRQVLLEYLEFHCDGDFDGLEDRLAYEEDARTTGGA